MAALLLGAALILAPPATAQSTTDYDDDNDGLIDVRSLAQLSAIRHDPNGNGDATHADYASAFPNRVTTSSGRMGCPTSGGCTGYELRADLSFDENGDGQITSADSTYWNSGSGWSMLGLGWSQFTAAFRGNGHTVSYLYINRTGSDHVGLFGYVGDGGSIDGVGLPHAYVRGGDNVGALAGSGGSYTRAWATGRVEGSAATGGLIGSTGKTIKASWAAVTVSGGTSASPAGGLAGTISSGTGNIDASWSGGRVDSTNGGGLLGRLASGSTVTNSYWDTGTSGQSSSAGGTGKSTRELQRLTGYSGIYANWNIDTDGVTGGDDPWHFGTSRQYPALKFTGRTTHRGPAWIEADHWNAPVAGEPIVVGLYTKTARALVDPAATITTCDGVANTNSRQAWVWERSDDGRTSWTTVTSTRGPACSYVYVPSSTDVGKYLRARVARTSGGNAYTLATAAVVASSAATTATATFAGGNASPVVGTAVTVSPLPTHSDRTLWRWQRCTASDGTGTCTLLAPGTPSWSYTPVAADAGGYLRAFVYYSSDASTPVWTRAATGFTGAVAASN